MSRIFVADRDLSIIFFLNFPRVVICFLLFLRKDPYRRDPFAPACLPAFGRWLKQRKWHWKASKMERESKNTPPLEEDFYRWLAERKKVWRLQRLTKRHSGGRGLLSVRGANPGRLQQAESVLNAGQAGVMSALEAEG